MRTILIDSHISGVHEFSKIISASTSGYHVATSIDQAQTEDIEVAIIWLQVPKYLSKLKNLKLLLICGSGVDHAITSPELPKHVPTVRLVDPYLRNRVSNYVLEQINNKYPSADKNHHPTSQKQRNKNIKPKVGIMGLGLVGNAIAEKLQQSGFPVCGWVRTSKSRSIEEVYVGNDHLYQFASECVVLVCQLPLTDETREILNHRLFDALPLGSYLINTGRGAHLNESDLLMALETGKLSGACLDVLQVEPITPHHPFSSNQKITVTPHIAGYVGFETQAPYAAQIINSFFRNEKIAGVLDYNTKY